MKEIFKSKKILIIISVILLMIAFLFFLYVISNKNILKLKGSTEPEIEGSVALLGDDLALYSKKFILNSELGYIYTNTVTKEKDIINNIYFLPLEETMEILHSVVYKNKYKLLLLVDELINLDLIKVTSSKYKIKDNKITYYGEFNPNNVRVTNATTEVVNNKLVIKYKDALVDEFELVRLNDLIGDTNNDGEITISDMILQYKHVEYDLDLEEDAFYRADIDSNDDVASNDVDMLYEIIKNK